MFCLVDIPNVTAGYGKLSSLITRLREFIVIETLYLHQISEQKSLVLYFLDF